MLRFNLPSAASLITVICLACVSTSCSNHEKAVPSGPVRVSVDVAGSGLSADKGHIYSGTVNASDETTVSFSVPGTITDIYVEEGQKVSKGQLLARVKSENLVNSRNIAQAELEEARDAYQRLKKLHDANALPDVKWVEIQAKLKQAENAAQLADRAVGDATIYSPISGFVTEKFADKGQTVVPAEPIVKIVNLNKLQIAIAVPENEISSFTENATAVVTFDAPEKTAVDAGFSSKDIVADPLTRTYTVKFDIGETSAKILPGMIGSVAVEGLNNQNGSDSIEIIVPSRAVLLGSDNRQFVWTVKDGKAIRKYVVADELSADGVRVRSGLDQGDSVIVSGMQKVSTGTIVEVVR